MTDTLSDYLRDFREQYTADDVLGWLDKIHKLRPTVIGDAIVDRFDFVQTIGKSHKDPALAVLRKSTEVQAGGALAVANHCAGLCQSVQLITQLGDIDRREEFIRGALRLNVLATFLTQTGAPTICKTRYVDEYTGVKLLEVYQMDDTLPDNPYQYQLNEAVSSVLPESDLILAADFGHGLFAPRLIRRLWASGVFLAVNAQTNASNAGFNLISRWQRADYVSVANHEVALEARQKDGEDQEKLLEIAKRIACPRWTVTRGKYGTLHYDVSEEKFYSAPALATKVVDRIGAGDSVFAITSLLVKIGAPWPIVAFIGNVTGAIQVETLCNRTALQRKVLDARIVELLRT